MTLSKQTLATIAALVFSLGFASGAGLISLTAAEEIVETAVDVVAADDVEPADDDSAE